MQDESLNKICSNKFIITCLIFILLEKLIKILIFMFLIEGPSKVIITGMTIPNLSYFKPIMTVRFSFGVNYLLNLVFCVFKTFD